MAQLPSAGQRRQHGLPALTRTTLPSMLRSGAPPKPASAALWAARGQHPAATLLQRPPVLGRAVRCRSHPSAAPTPVVADARASVVPELIAAGFGARGVAVCEQLLTSGALPPQACLPLPGDTAAANAAALKSRACGCCVLLGNPAEPSALAAVQLAQLLCEAGIGVCAVLASPFAFEGARKAAAAADVVRALRSCDLLVLVEQESLFQSTAGMTLSQATAAADGVLCGAVSCLQHLLASQARVLRQADGKSEDGAASFLTDVKRLVALAGLPAASRASAHACFGTGASAFTAGDSDTAAAAAVIAATYSAVATPFLSHVRTSPAAACICVVRAASPMSDAGIQAATQAMSNLFSGCPLLLTSVADPGAATHVHVDLLVLSRPTEVAEAEPRAASDASAQQRKSWSAMTRLAAGTAEPRKPLPALDAKPAEPASPAIERIVAPVAAQSPTVATTPLPAVAAPVAAPAVVAAPSPAVAAPVVAPIVAATPPAVSATPSPAAAAPLAAAAAPPPVLETPETASLFATDPGNADDYTAQETAPDAEQPRSRVGALLKLLGLQKPPEQSIIQRASAVLANDRAASRVVVRMTFPDGSSYEGEVLDGLPHGIGRRVYSNGSWYAGEWQSGQRQGWGVSQTGGERYEGLWAQGVPVGVGKDP